ncbi:MAG: hypothetical protein A3K19_09500 [Lentisphaerae bacterium RIFOXYB12_FULL_65_16]|nr:MAG: hypothetical protein A3K18_03520 [Lentisphaerae bacterium RIFOXYA12_64_32]OGV90486.1 MAG: hypothetical protein A3K19_09500 [Lentisphaerae bacterium RIFOXYB12_FULL_65_16]
MMLWHVKFLTPRPLSALPCVLAVCSERQFGPAYRHFGIYRQAERHCLFKYTLKGEGAFRDGRSEYRLPAGRGFLCRIWDVDTSYYYPEDAQEPWEFVWIALEGAPGVAVVDDMVRRYGPVYDVPLSDEAILRLLEFRRHNGTTLNVTPAEGADVVMTVLLALARSKEKHDDQGSANRLVLQARERVADRLQENLNVSRLAALLGVSREHLTRVFKEQTGMTPHEYMARQRILLACHLLKESAKSSKEISVELGYESPAHFTRIFKRMLGMTPGRFRGVGSIPHLWR